MKFAVKVEVNVTPKVTLKGKGTGIQKEVKTGVKVTVKAKVLKIEQKLKTFVSWPFEDLGHFKNCFFAFELGGKLTRRKLMLKVKVRVAIKVTVKVTV